MLKKNASLKRLLAINISEDDVDLADDNDAGLVADGSISSDWMVCRRQYGKQQIN